VNPPRRIVIIGNSGSGKTTLADGIASRLSIPHIELDALHWEPNWTEAATEVFRARVAAALAGEAWVVDGNYKKARDLIWPRADTVVWLDYSLPLIMRRVTVRTFGRWARREMLWGTNRESLRNTLLTRESIIWWAFTNYRPHRRRTHDDMRDPAYAHLRRVHLRNPRETARWLAALAAP
jgi:adenylate kinase family enzyme